MDHCRISPSLAMICFAAESAFKKIKVLHESSPSSSSPIDPSSTSSSSASPSTTSHSAVAGKEERCRGGSPHCVGYGVIYCDVRPLPS